MKGFTFDLQRFAEYTFTYDAEATDGNKYILNGTGYATPTDAFNTLSDGDTVKLESDVEHTINSYVLIQGANLEKDGRGVVTKYDPRTITLDLNGHKWTRTAKGNYVFRLSSGGHLVVEDSSEAKTGEIAVAEDIVGKATSSVIYVANGGSFTLNSGKIVNYGNDGNDAGKYAVYGINVNTDAVNITINGGSVETPNNTGEKNKAILGNGSVDCTTITVNEGAKITSGSYGIEIIKANLVVNGGTIESTGDKAAIGVLNSTSTATISGGTIKSAKGVAVNFATPNGSLNISGGTIDGGIIVNEKSTLDIAADYTGLIKSPVTVDGTTKYYTTDEWAQVKDTLEEKTIDQTTQYYTEDGWAQRESNVLVPTLFKNSTNGTTTVTFAEGDNFVEGTNLIEAKLNGKVQYFTTVDKCKALLSICNEETLDGETGYYSSNVFNALEKVTVTYDGKYPTYFTPAYWENLKGSLLTAEINGATKYFTTEAKLTSTVKTYIAITVDDTTKYYTTQTLADAAIDGKIAVLIDDETQYFTSADTLAAAVAKHNYITVIIDDTTKYFTTQTLADAAVNGKTEIEIDGTTKYFTDAQQAQNLLANAVTATVDDTTKYFTNNETLAAAIKNYFAVTVGGTTSYYTTEELAKAARAKAIENSEAAIGDEYFSTFAAAVSAAKSGDTVTVLKNITLDETLAVNKNLTLDLGGKTFTSTADTAIQVSGGNFTLQGDGKLDAANIAIDLSDAAATATIDGGTVKGKLVSSATGRENVGFTLNGGTFANSAIKAGAKLLVDDKNVLIAEGWNQTAANTFDYIVAPENGFVGTKILSVSGVTSTDQIKFDAAQKLFTVPTTATVSDAPEGYKVIKLTYDKTFSTATVKTDKDAIEITENLLADTVTKISASGNTNTIYISGGEKVTSIVGGKNNDTLTGTGDKLTLTGGAGNDIFVYETGNAVITDYAAGADKISVKAVPTKFEFKGSNLVLTSDDGTLTVNGAKGKTITFTDGQTDTERTFLDGGAVNDGEKVTLDENFKGSTYNISKAKDVTEIDASTATKNINLVGNNLGNTIRGGSGNDTLTGGVTAADEYTGNAGADTFVYNGGADKITDYKSSDGDTIKLAKNFTVKSAAFGDDDAVFTFNVKGNTMTLSDAANDTITVKDASNKVWTYAKDFTANANGVTLNSSATGFDASGSTTLVTLDGSAASAVKLTGNKKNNVFVGTKGADTFVYTAGSDVITNYDSTDKVQVDDFGSITAAKFGTKTVLTVGKGAITFNNAPKEINLVDAQGNAATFSKDGIVTDDNSIQLLNGTKIYSGTASTVDATNVKNALTLSGGKAVQTFTGVAGKTLYTYDGAAAMTIENYAAGDKISVKGSVKNFAVSGEDVTLTVGEGSIVLKGAAKKLITLHDDSDKAGKYTARAYLQTGVTADKAIPTAVTLSSSVTEYSAPSTVKQITYTGGEVTLKNFDTTKGKINHGKLAITDVATNKLTFGTDGTLTLDEHDATKKVQLTSTNDKGKSVNSTVWLGDHALYDNTVAKATKVSVTSGDDNREFTAGEKIKSVTALGSEKLSIAGNKLNNTLTANGAGDTLDGGTGTDVLIGGNGNDVFIHDKLTGTTTINNYTSTDSIKLSGELSVVGSAYSAGKKNGTLTLTVANSDNASTSKIVIKSDDFTKEDVATYGTIVIDEKQTSFGKNAIYSDSKVKLLSTFSGKFTASASSEVDGSDATKALTLHGSKDSDTLTGGAFKTTLTGGKGNDTLTGGAGKDVFVYASGDGEDVIADFTYNEDKLKVSSKGIISKISVDQGDLKFDMKDGGSVTIDDLKGDFVIKANKTLYWFDGGELVTSKTKTADMNTIINDKTGSYAVVNLEYSTNLVTTAKIATYTDTTFNATTYKKTT